MIQLCIGERTDSANGCEFLLNAGGHDLNASGVVDLGFCCLPPGLFFI